MTKVYKSGQKLVILQENRLFITRSLGEKWAGLNPELTTKMKILSIQYPDLEMAFNEIMEQIHNYLQFSFVETGMVTAKYLLGMKLNNAF